MARMKKRLAASRGAIASLVLVAAACGGDAPGPADSTLGVVDFGVPCQEAVRGEFDRGIALLHHMTYPGALASFQAVVQQDPDCALAYWGAGMTYFQPLWPNRPQPEDLTRGWALMQEARRRVRGAGRESDFVATGEAFFDPSGEPDYWMRIERWADATEALARAHSDDLEAQAFYALTLLAVAARADDPASVHERAADVLARIVATEPTHPGAVHYTIHANDFVGREHESLDVVGSYGEIAPANAHALHMPTHIYVRLGAWDDVISWNLRARDAALTQRVGPDGRYVWDEYPHAIEYMVYAQLQKGDDDAALELIRSLERMPDIQPSFKTAFHFASTRARYALERHDWQGASELTVRDPSTLSWDAFPWPEAITWFARGLGGAHLGDAGMTVESLDRLGALARRAADANEPLFASQIEILRLELDGWRAFRAGDREGAVRRLQEAVGLEERTPKHPVTPAPTIPAMELLADLYLEVGDAARARDAYAAAADRAPGRFNTVLGLARTSAALGDVDAARRYYQALVDAAAPTSSRGAIGEAKDFLGGA